MTSILILLLIIDLSAGALIKSTQKITFIILSQPNDFHKQIAENLLINITHQYKDLEQESPMIYLTHKDFSHAGTWTIFPVLMNTSKINSSNLDWLIFLQDNTGVNLKQLFKNLGKHNHSEKIWLGNELYDTDATIIHHFGFYNNPSFLKYPNIASGFAISAALLESIVQHLKNNVRLPDFNIDNSYELALFIWDKGRGQTLTYEPSFCIENDPHCATYVNPYGNQNNPIPNKDIFFLVKTCERYHGERIPILKNTWGKTAKNIKYFSNVEDKSIPTIDLGVRNTERGHCAKTMAILKHIYQEFEESGIYIPWISVVDDDTLLSVSRLQHLLSRYNHSQDVAIGERYGYNMAYTPLHGYNYITGGGGMIFSIPLVKKLLLNCKCPAPDSPDDMIIGACMTKLNIEITHSPAFHQARPVDYSPKYLQNQEPVSFHKHWLTDLVKVYKKWLDNTLNDVRYEL